MSAKKREFFMVKEGERLEFAGRHQKTLYNAWLKSLPAGQIVQMMLQKRTHEKTHPQMGYWHAVVLPCATQALIDAGYGSLFSARVGGFQVSVETDSAAADTLLKALYQQHRQLPETPQKRSMTDEEMSCLIDFALGWLAETLDCFVPSPKE